MSSATRTSTACQTHAQRHSGPEAEVLSLRAGLLSGDDHTSKNEACPPNAHLGEAHPLEVTINPSGGGDAQRRSATMRGCEPTTSRLACEGRRQ